jgi:NADH:ubiquinone oxidoreductase subunit 3 (subunit A)
VDLDKSSAYECGFDAFGDSRQTFSVSFYLVAIMYLLFDIEVRLHKGSGVVCVL